MVKLLFYYLSIIILLLGCNDKSITGNEETSTTGGSEETSTTGGSEETSTTGQFDPTINSISILGFESLDSIKIIVNVADDLAGFQFDLIGGEILDCNGALASLASDAGFTVSCGEETVLGFSFSGNVIPSESTGILTHLYGNFSSQICLDNLVFSDQDGNEIPYENFGACIEY